MSVMEWLDRVEAHFAVRIQSEANRREHWAAKAKRVKAQREAVRAEWLVLRRPRVRLPAVVEFTRLAPGRIRDDDNLMSGFKAVRDEVAELFLGVDDGDPRVTWKAPTQSRTRDYGALAIITHVEGDDSERA